MLDELAHAGPGQLDPAFVAGYQRKQGSPDPAEDLTVLAAHGLDATSTVVDLGAGTGRFSLGAARRVGQVIAVDISPAMPATAERARRRGPSHQPSPGASEVPQPPAHRLEPMLAAAGFELLTADFSRSVYGAHTCRRR